MVSTVLWEGSGLEVRKTVIVGAFIELVGTTRQPGDAGYEQIARVYSAAQAAKAEKNPESWAQSVIRQRLRTAQKRIIVCQGQLDCAQQNGARWEAVAEQLGIQR